jgi:hypothetical protein
VATLIMWHLMTLDDFVEGPNRDMSFVLPSTRSSSAAARRRASLVIA